MSSRSFTELKDAFKKVATDPAVWDEYFDTLMTQRLKSDAERKEIVEILIATTIKSSSDARHPVHVEIKRWEEIFKRCKSEQTAPFLPADLPDRLTDLSLLMLEKGTERSDYREEYIKIGKFFADNAREIAAVMAKDQKPPAAPISSDDVQITMKQPVRFRIVDGETPKGPEA